MSTSSYLANFGVTIEQASQYVHANMHDLHGIAATARQYGITDEMLGEIAGHAAGTHYSGAEVRGYLAGFGVNTAGLSAESLFPSEMLQFSSVMTLNVETGTLSTASLRTQVIARTGEAAYNAAFDPNHYAGGLDGVFSVADLGVSSLGDLPATAQTLESLFYGTIVRLAGTLDMQEAFDVAAFVNTHRAAMESGDPAVESAFLALMHGIVEDHAMMPALTDTQIAQAAVASAVALVGFASQHDQSLFAELLTGFAF